MIRVASATQAAGPGRASEDYAAVSDDLIVLLDGATVPTGLETGCTHGTRWLARQLGATIFAGLSQYPELGIADGVADAIKRFSQLHGQTCDTTHPNQPSTTIAVLRETADDFEYFVLSDSTIVLDTDDGVLAITDDRLERVAIDQRRALRATGIGTPQREEALAALIAELRRLRNTENGFWVATADPDVAYHALTGRVARSAVRRAAVLSDGASILVDRYRQATWPQALSIMAQEGPDAFIRRVRDAERSDPDATRWPRRKTHDDATAVFCVP